MRPLFGNYELTLDEKNRLLVPSDIRKAWNPEDSESLVIVPGINRKLWLYTEKFYEVMAGQMESELTPENEKEEYDQINFALAQRIEMDKQGRVCNHNPDKLRLSVIRVLPALAFGASWCNQCSQGTVTAPGNAGALSLTDLAALLRAWRHPTLVLARRLWWPEDQVRVGIRPVGGSPASRSKDRSRQRRETSTA